MKTTARTYWISFPHEQIATVSIQRLNQPTTKKLDGLLDLVLDKLVRESVELPPQLPDINPLVMVPLLVRRSPLGVPSGLPPRRLVSEYLVHLDVELPVAAQYALEFV